MLPQPNGNNTVVMRSYIHWAKFSKTMVAPINSVLIDCTILHNFYGGGYLGSVDGDVVSTLDGDTHVYGSVFGGGYSASIPSFPVHDKDSVHYAYSDKTGYIHDGWLDYKRYKEGMNLGEHHLGDTIYYEWIDNARIQELNWSVTPSTNSPAFEDPTGNTGNWYCFTNESLTNLGAITGDVTLTLKGSTKVEGNVYGGGDMSAVIQTASLTKGNTIVKLHDGTRILGNVYGGGNKGRVDGDASVTIEDEPQNP